MRPVPGQEIGTQPDPGSVNLEVRFGRDGYVVVLRLAEHAALGFADADHHKRPAVDADDLSDGVGVGEEAALDVGAEKHDGQPPLILDFGEEPAPVDLRVSHDRGFRRYSLPAYAVDQIGPVGS